KEHDAKLAQIELQNRKNFKNLIDAIPNTVWIVDGKLNAEQFNRTWSEYTGMDFENSSGTGWMSAFLQEDLSDFLDAWETSQLNSTFQVEIRMYNQKDKSHRWQLIKAVAQSTIANKSWLITSTDIHELK